VHSTQSKLITHRHEFDIQHTVLANRDQIFADHCTRQRIPDLDCILARWHLVDAVAKQ
jgi:hypothetical protein